MQITTVILLSLFCIIFGVYYTIYIEFEFSLLMACFITTPYSIVLLPSIYWGVYKQRGHQMFKSLSLIILGIYALVAGLV